jgi:8-oxo-dGTP diphosphatase
VLRGAFVPNDEVDEVRWVPPEEAAALLTYDRDQAVLESAVAPSGH